MVCRVAVPGSFDPVTVGHVDLIERAKALFGNVLVIVTQNLRKKYMFSLQERQFMLNMACRNILQENNIVTSMGLLANTLKNLEISVVVRGIRSPLDVDFETSMAQINSHLCPDLETVLLSAVGSLRHVRSSWVQELLLLKADVSSYVPENVLEYVLCCLNKNLKGDCLDSKNLVE